MKLLGETYLNGRVAFTSDENTGTIFTFELPRFFQGPGLGSRMNPKI